MVFASTEGGMGKNPLTNRFFMLDHDVSGISTDLVSVSRTFYPWMPGSRSDPISHCACLEDQSGGAFGANRRYSARVPY